MATSSNYFNFADPRTSNAYVMKQLEGMGIANFASFNGQAVVASAYASATGQAAEVMASVTKNYARAIRERRGTFQNMYEAVGKEAVEAVRRSYNSRNRTGIPQYRGGDRETGKLGKALQSPQMYRAAPDGIDFINTAYLDSQAKQWYRLNFGAGAGKGHNVGPRGRGSAARIVFFGQQTGMDLQLNQRPSPNFKIPPGYFFSPNLTSVQNVGDRGGAFFPAKMAPRERVHFVPKAQGIGQNTQATLFRGGYSKNGIAAQRFLDAGAATIARLAPAGNEKIIGTLASEALTSSKGPLAKGAVSKEILVGTKTLAETSLAMRELSARQAKIISKIRSY